jgi:hypothetical protein
VAGTFQIQFPEQYLTAKPGWAPDLEAIERTRKYNEELGRAGVLLALDGLTPPATMSARVIFENGRSRVTDGPFAEAKEVVGGYWVIEVRSREEALEWASRIPGTDGRSSSALRLLRFPRRRSGKAREDRRGGLRRGPTNGGAPLSYRFTTAKGGCGRRSVRRSRFPAKEFTGRTASGRIGWSATTVSRRGP